MLEPGDPTEDATAGRADDAQPGIPRLIGAAFKRERKRTERLFNQLVAAVSAEIGRMEEGVQNKLDWIDTSLSLIARELSRRGGGRQSDEAG